MAQDPFYLHGCQECMQVFLSEQLLHGLCEQNPLNVRIINVYVYIYIYIYMQIEPTITRVRSINYENLAYPSTTPTLRPPVADLQPSQLHPYISVLFSSKPISLKASPKLFVPPTATARTRLL